MGRRREGGVGEEETGWARAREEGGGEEGKGHLCNGSDQLPDW